MIELSQPNFSHLIIAITERRPDDANYHINFYKLVYNETGAYGVFDYRLDAIQIPTTDGPLDA